MVGNTGAVVRMKKRICPQVGNPANTKAVAPQEIMQIAQCGIEKLRIRLQVVRNQQQQGMVRRYRIGAPHVIRGVQSVAVAAGSPARRKGLRGGAGLCQDFTVHGRIALAFP